MIRGRTFGRAASLDYLIYATPHFLIHLKSIPQPIDEYKTIVLRLVSYNISYRICRQRDEDFVSNCFLVHPKSIPQPIDELVAFPVFEAPISRRVN